MTDSLEIRYLATAERDMDDSSNRFPTIIKWRIWMEY